MQKNYIRLFFFSMMVFFFCACRKHHDNADDHDEFARFSLGDRQYFLYSPRDSLVFTKEGRRTAIIFYPRGTDSAVVNATLWDTVPTSNRGFVIISVDSIPYNDGGAYYTIDQYGPVGDYIEFHFHGSNVYPPIPMTGHIRVKRRS